MSLQPAAPRTTLAAQVARMLETLAEDDHDARVRRRALMYAEAIDEADEADALFRFGPKLRVCLDALGLDLPTHAAPRALAAAGSTSAAA